MREGWQPKRVAWTEKAQADMKSLGKQRQQWIVEKVELYAATGHGNVIRLQGRDRVWRLALGDWRVLFTLDPTANPAILGVLRVRPRGSAYQP